MRISIFSAFFPFRGGIAQFNARLYRELEKNNEVFAFTFKKQYPDFLFPGKTQLVTSKDVVDPIPAKRILSPFNPFTYFGAIRQIRRTQPGVLIVNHWMSFFGFAFGILARFQSRNTLRVALIHNLVPHEKRFFDRYLNRFMVNSFDCFVVLSEEVKKDLIDLRPNAVVWKREHPWYDHFGSKMDRVKAAERIGIDPDRKTILFFGLIRDYKGLDVLLDSFNELSEEYQLVIAGEVYGKAEKYIDLISQNRNRERIFLFDRYIDDNDVKNYFSAADVCVLPYRSATQSGVTAVSFHFEVPVIVTNVGALKDTVENAGGGIVVPDCSKEALLRGINDFFAIRDRKQMIGRISMAKQANSWGNFSNDLNDFLIEKKASISS